MKTQSPNFTDDLHQFAPVKRGLPGFENAGQIVSSGPPFRTAEEAEDWIDAHEKALGYDDSGMGSGYIVEQNPR